MSYERALNRVSRMRNLAPVPVTGWLRNEDYEGPGSTITWGSWRDGQLRRIAGQP